ncbi:hypothetical protein [Streptomyces sp. VRA16 Mangrove soil]|uniref:hypothetical protein n=1 Tax=Streptomyces sp. VRA16 Mangrove soil TaxID=2817434 RepID=UPI001A9D1D04|nr:hypothetical protein [Streptomyces sp. VRA16 Mangrove soil]MBO1336693.1 hypothetical protein [Streptomyces sp. VRA16 Mangrove soil]
MGFFKRQEVDHYEADRALQAEKRRGSQELNAIRDRIGDGTATDQDYKIFRKVTGIKRSEL